jgi:hypothetical protein
MACTFYSFPISNHHLKFPVFDDRQAKPSCNGLVNEIMSAAPIYQHYQAFVL